MIHVIAMVTAKPGRREQVLGIFGTNVPAVLAEEGCLEYGAAIDVADADPAFGPDVFVVVEKWSDQEALRPHAASPHMAAYRRATADLLESVAVHVLDPAG